MRREFSITNYLNSNQENNLDYQLFDDDTKKKIAELWITNASYYLKEHEVIILNILSCDSICIRLCGPLFSVS